MPDQTRKPDLKSLSGEVDRLLRQLNPAAHARPRPVATAPTAPPPTGGFPSRRGYPRPGFPAPPVVAPTPIALPSRSGVWLRAALGALLAGGLTQWPYALCGFPLAAYLAAVAVVLVAGGWAGHASWRRRMGLAHIVALAVLFTGAGLAALQVLPRVGYAAAEIAWRCTG